MSTNSRAGELCVYKENKQEPQLRLVYGIRRSNWSASGARAGFCGAGPSILALGSLVLGPSKEVSNTEANVPHHLARNFSIFYVMTTKRLKLRLILMKSIRETVLLTEKRVDYDRASVASVCGIP